MESGSRSADGSTPTTASVQAAQPQLVQTKQPSAGPPAGTGAAAVAALRATAGGSLPMGGEAAASTAAGAPSTRVPTVPALSVSPPKSPPSAAVGAAAAVPAALASGSGSEQAAAARVAPVVLSAQGVVPKSSTLLTGTAAPTVEPSVTSVTAGSTLGSIAAAVPLAALRPGSEQREEAGSRGTPKKVQDHAFTTTRLGGQPIRVEVSCGSCSLCSVCMA